MAQIHALTPEGRLPSAAQAHALEVADSKYGQLYAPGNLGSSTHLDSLTTPGRWKSYAASVAGRPEYGYPEGAMHGVLDVIEVRPTNPPYTLQVWVDTWQWFVARRRLYAGTWTEWVREPDETAVADMVNDLTGPLAERVSALESGGSGAVSVQPGNAVVYGTERPDRANYPASTTVFWNNLDGTTVVPPGYRGDGYVGALPSGYTTLQVRKVNSVQSLAVSCLNPVTGRHITHMIAGPSGTSDDQRRFTNGYVGPYSGTTVTDEYTILPRSNMEWAFQVDVDGNAQFAPYHGTNSAKAFQYDEPVFTHLDGTVIDVAGASNGILPGVTDGLKIRQALYVTHPDSGDTRWVRVDEVKTILPDGMIQFEGVMTFLEDTKVGNFYAPMTPVGAGRFDQMHVLGGESYDVATTAPGTTSYTQIAEQHAASSFLFTATGHDQYVAVTLLDPDRTLARGHKDEETGNRALQLEERNTGLVKLYPGVFTSGTVIPAGFVWRFGAQWRYGETPNPHQYIAETIPVTNSVIDAYRAVRGEEA